MINTIEPTTTAVLFDDKSAVEAFMKKGWLEKIANGKTPEESLCRYTSLGMEFKHIISRFEAPAPSPQGEVRAMGVPDPNFY